MAIRPGTNIAVKTPTFRYSETVAFSRDAVGLEVLDEGSDTTKFRFGALTLWIDRVDTATHAETWLELTTDDLETATNHLVTHGGHRRDEIEDLGDAGAGWMSDPGGTILLLRRSD
ncbi:MAG: VOC family protein [Ilumatobacter sp.]